MLKWKEIALVVSATLICLLLGEASVRVINGYSLLHFRLTSDQPPTAQLNADTAQVNADSVAWAHVRKYVVSHPVAPTVDKGWFDLDPPQLPEEPVDPELAQRYLKYPEIPSQYEWNYSFLLLAVCTGSDLVPNANRFQVFEPTDGSARPRYRYPRNKTLATGLKTNAFGWRGPQISLNRPPATIRVAFLGASTTVSNHGYPFSYPEYVGNWLNVWARSQHLPLNFEIINAGHEGYNSADISALVRDDLLAVDPDIVVYYEGSNQFWPLDFIELPEGQRPSKPEKTFRSPPWVLAHFAVARRLEFIVERILESGGEPQKPVTTLEWPKALNEFNPDITNPKKLPLRLPQILSDLLEIKRNLDSIHSTFAISSFIWLAYDGMRLDLPHQQPIYSYLNDTWWPYRYSEIRRMADFQNRVFKNFAVNNRLPFFDIAHVFPQDSELFSDAIHMLEPGIKLQAWLVMQQLMPILQERIANGTLPRPLGQPALAVQPDFMRPAKTVTRAELLEEGAALAPDRDARRKSDLQRIRDALEAYARAYGTYRIKGAGSNGEGYINSRYGKNVSVVEALYESGFLNSASIEDPWPAMQPNYMIYLCGGDKRYSLSATLEQPSLGEIAHAQKTCNALGQNGTYSSYHKNYALEN